MRSRGEREKRKGGLRVAVLVCGLFLLFNISDAAQDQPPDPAKECAELQKSVETYNAETARIKLTLSFKNNSGYWRGASEELSFGIARRKLANSLQAVAFKLGVKRLKDWDIVPLEEKLAYQQKVARALESEKEKSISADGAALEARLAEIEKQLKAIALRSRDLACADIPAETNKP